MTSKNSKKKSSTCFITTAVCDSFNKPDDCYELTIFRNFRDNWLLQQKNGKELIEEYYKIAPAIVTNIDSLQNPKLIYKEIWKFYLQPCLLYLEQGENEKCKKMYIKMVETLKQYYY